MTFIEQTGVFYDRFGDPINKGIALEYSENIRFDNNELGHTFKGKSVCFAYPFGFFWNDFPIDSRKTSPTTYLEQYQSLSEEELNNTFSNYSFIPTKDFEYETDVNFNLYIEKDYKKYESLFDGKIIRVTDNKQYFTIEEMKHTMELIKEIVPTINLKFIELETQIKVNVSGYANRPQTLFVCNILRRHWRFHLAAVLKAVVEIYDSKKTNFNFWELVVMSDWYLYPNAMYDDYLACDGPEKLKFKSELMLYRALQSEAYLSDCLLHNTVRIMGNASIEQRDLVESKRREFKHLIDINTVITKEEYFKLIYQQAKQTLLSIIEILY